MTNATTHSKSHSEKRKVHVYHNHWIEIDALDSLNLLTNHGVYEPDETALCQQLINCGDRVLDIGANIGYYTLLFSDLVSPTGCVNAVEPDRDNFVYLQRNLADQIAANSVFLHQVALGDSAQQARLYRATENTGMHRLYSSVCCSDDSTEVSVLIGDSLKLAPLDFIKIDIEGYEPAAICGLTETLKHSPNLKILCEFSPLSLWEAGFSPIEFLKEMRASGLRLVVQHSKKWQTGSFDEMEQALAQIPQSAITPFIDKLQKIESNQDIHQQAAAFLEQHQYPRPLLENILLVANDAWETVCNTLQINHPSITTTVIKKRWRCRWASKHDKAVFLSLFQSAFGDAMPANLWMWKYDHQDKYGIFAHVDGKIIAYYGGLPRKFWLNGETIPAVQICDVMVAPNMRGILTRKGPFMHTADTFLTAQIGRDKTYHFAFGFPSDRAARLGEKSAWYARTDTFFKVTWPAATALPFWFKTTPLKADRYVLVDSLWKAMQTSLPNVLLPIKDATFFKWRYQGHPNRDYSSYIVSWRGINKVIGIVTLQDHGPDMGMEIMDLLAPASKLKTLLIAAQNICINSGRRRLFSWMTPAILPFLPKPSQQAEVSGVYITPDHKKIIDQQKISCWLMSGDTDFR
ncbi:MAG: FkbM family methyltransferase [Betaproteobacteria bacterium]|nr:FkbM family methyltransferase [Betaproteobacteria bacterium]